MTARLIGLVEDWERSAGNEVGNEVSEKVGEKVGNVTRLSPAMPTWLLAHKMSRIP